MYARFVRPDRPDRIRFLSSGSVPQVPGDPAAYASALAAIGVEAAALRALVVAKIGEPALAEARVVFEELLVAEDALELVRGPNIWSGDPGDAGDAAALAAYEAALIAFEAATAP
jgi:hypothetical protein